MSRIVVSEFLTLDGVMEAPGGEFHPDGKGGWTFPFFGEEAGGFKFDELLAADGLLLGRVTYQHFAAVWPSMADERGFAERMNALPKFVASTTLKGPLAWNATLLEGDVAGAVAELKQQPGGDILVFGSGELVRTLVRHGLVDEFRLMLFPILLGSGRRLFPEASASTALRLLETRTFASGVIVVSYAPAAPA